MAATLGDDVGLVDLLPPAEPTEVIADRPGRRRTLVAVAWITLPRLAVAFALSALTERAALVGTAGPDVRGAASGLLNWDAGHYLSIAEHGYVAAADTPFFPLQSLLARPLAEVIGFPNAVIAVSWIALGSRVWGIVDVASRFTTHRGAVAAALLFAWNPVSVFLVSGYAESLFVALTVWSLRYCLERRWVWAAILAGAASAVDPAGRRRGGDRGARHTPGARGVRRLTLALGCGIVAEAGLIGFALYCWDRFGNPVEFQKAASEFWQQRLTYPLHAFVEDLRLSDLRGGAPRSSRRIMSCTS